MTNDVVASDEPSCDDTLAELKQQLERCSPEQQWELIYHLVHGILGDDPGGEVILRDEEGIAYASVVPAWLRFDLVERPKAQWDELAGRADAEPGPARPLEEILSELAR